MKMKTRTIVWRIVRSDLDHSKSTYHWEIIGKNGKVLARSPEFQRKRDAVKTVQELRRTKISFIHVCEY